MKKAIYQLLFLLLAYLIDLYQFLWQVGTSLSQATHSLRALVASVRIFSRHPMKLADAETRRSVHPSPQRWPEAPPEPPAHSNVKQDGRLGEGPQMRIGRRRVQGEEGRRGRAPSAKTEDLFGQKAEGAGMSRPETVVPGKKDLAHV